MMRQALKALMMTMTMLLLLLMLYQTSRVLSHYRLFRPGSGSYGVALEVRD